MVYVINVSALAKQIRNTEILHTVLFVGFPVSGSTLDGMGSGDLSCSTIAKTMGFASF